jgi:hypothetical protein
MTRSQIRAFVDSSSVEHILEVAFLLDLRDHEAFFRNLADAKLQR